MTDKASKDAGVELQKGINHFSNKFLSLNSYNMDISNKPHSIKIKFHYKAKY